MRPWSQQGIAQLAASILKLYVALSYSKSVNNSTFYYFKAWCCGEKVDCEYLYCKTSPAAFTSEMRWKLVTDKLLGLICPKVFQRSYDKRIGCQQIQFMDDLRHFLRKKYGKHEVAYQVVLGKRVNLIVFDCYINNRLYGY
jgi:hypothetical protein